MQDRSPPARRSLLRRTAGPYIWVNHRHAAGATGPIDLRKSDIEFPGPMIPLALFRAVHGLGRAARAIERDLLYDGISLGRHETGKGERCLGIVGHHDQVVTGVMTHFIHTLGAPGANGVGDLLREQINDFERAVSVPRPYLPMPDDENAIRARGVIVAGRAGKRSLAELHQYGVGGGIDHIDGLIRAIAENVETDGRIDEADVEGKNLLGPRQCDCCRWPENFICCRSSTSHQEQNWENVGEISASSKLIEHCRLPWFTPQPSSAFDPNIVCPVWLKCN